MKKLHKIFTIISRVVGAISFIGLFIGVIFIIVDVILRYLFNSPIPGDYDITQLWLSVIVFASMAYVQTEKGHIAVGMLLKVLPRRLAISLYGVATLLGVFITGCCSYSCFAMARRALARNMVSMSANIPLAPFEFFEAFCMALLCIVMLLDAIMIFMSLGSEEEMQKIYDTWA